jgi:hypothetical protein
MSRRSKLRMEAMSWASVGFPGMSWTDWWVLVDGSSVFLELKLSFDRLGSRRDEAVDERVIRLRTTQPTSNTKNGRNKEPKARPILPTILCNRDLRDSLWACHSLRGKLSIRRQFWRPCSPTSPPATRAPSSWPNIRQKSLLCNLRGHTSAILRQGWRLRPISRVQLSDGISSRWCLGRFRPVPSAEG